MKSLAFFALLLVFSSSIAAAQEPQTGLSFEAASIHPGASADEMIPIITEAQRARIHYVNASLRDCIRVAYGVKEFQISGPEWLSTRFNIEARYPEGATEAQVPEMLQSLLRDRFKLHLHRDTKEHAVLALVVGKNGSKLKESDVKASEYPDSPNRRPGTPVRGDIMIMGSPAGMHLKGPAVALTALSDTLSMFTDEPVVDQTGLNGRYDIDLVFVPENRPLMRGPRADAGEDPHTERVTVSEAVQQYGLKLEPRKAPITMLLIDHIEKTPTEN